MCHNSTQVTRILYPTVEPSHFDKYVSICKFGGDVMDRVTTCLRIAIQVITILDTFFIQLSIVKV